VENVAVNAKADILISGTAGSIPVNIAEAAAGTNIKSSVRLAINTAASVMVSLEGGSEGSTLEVTKNISISTSSTDSSNSVVIKNNTKQDIAVSTTTGSKTIDSGGNISEVPETPSAPDDGYGGNDADASTYSAQIGQNYYKTLQEAVNSVDTTPKTITLLKNVKENVTIWTGNNITLDLNGYNITNSTKSSPTIFIYLDSMLTIEGSGTVDNTGSLKTAVYNNGTLILNGGTYTRSTADETNAYYTLVNHGRLTVSGNAAVSNSQHASLIQNGYTNSATDYVSNVGISKPTLTVTGGTFTGGIYSIVNDQLGILAVSGGTFTGYSQKALQNNSDKTVTITGGYGIN
jgi:hypothetical protein